MLARLNLAAAAALVVVAAFPLAVVAYRVGLDGRPVPEQEDRPVFRQNPLVYLAAAAAVVALIVLAAASDAAPGRAPAPTVRVSSTGPITIHGRYATRTVAARAQTHRCERRLGVRLSPVSSRPVVGAAYARWVLALWRGRAQEACRLARELGHPVAAIRAVFGPYADEALVVSRCESGRGRSTRARNGQYLGTFQMGEHERALFGHGDTALEQAVAAHAYFVDSGRDWSPWSCKPDGSVR